MNYIVVFLSVISVLVVFSLMVFKTNDFSNLFNSNNNLKIENRNMQKKESFNNIIESLIDSINRKKNKSFNLNSIINVEKNKDNFKVRMELIEKGKKEQFMLDFDSNESFTNININEMFNIDKIEKLENEIDVSMEQFENDNNDKNKESEENINKPELEEEPELKDYLILGENENPDDFEDRTKNNYLKTRSLETKITPDNEFIGDLQEIFGVFSKNKNGKCDFEKGADVYLDTLHNTDEYNCVTQFQPYLTNRVSVTDRVELHKAITN